MNITPKVEKLERNTKSTMKVLSTSHVNSTHGNTSILSNDTKTRQVAMKFAYEIKL